jgi:hypothetical protein
MGISSPSGGPVERRSLGGAGLPPSGRPAQYLRNAHGDDGAGHGSARVDAVLRGAVGHLPSRLCPGGSAVSGEEQGHADGQGQRDDDWQDNEDQT